MKKNRILVLVIISLMALLSAICFFMAHKEKTDVESAVVEYEEIKQSDTHIEEPKDELGEESDSNLNDNLYLKVDFDSLQNANPDFVGWLEIPNTNISYPMVQSSNNEDYLYKTFKGISNKSGGIFVDYRSGIDFENDAPVIYGHNMQNKSMFGDLMQYFTQKDFAINHNEIRVYTKKGIYVYEVSDIHIETPDCGCFDFNESSDTDATISLVTCVKVNNPDRYVVKATLKGVV